MPRNQALAEEVDAWFLKAAHDLSSARALLSHSEPLTDTSVYHCQQAVEKALKGFLTSREIIFRKTHSIEELGEQAIANHAGTDLKDWIDRTVHMTEYAWRYRYPGEALEPDFEEAEEALRLAEGFVSFLRGLAGSL